MMSCAIQRKSNEIHPKKDTEKKQAKLKNAVFKMGRVFWKFQIDKVPLRIGTNHSFVSVDISKATMHKQNKRKLKLIGRLL